MNIKEAKQEIKDAITAYFSKDELGNFEVPVEKQRPVFLMGPPGIGKTAIMAQIAQELGVGLVTYSMTHHTRQSALGLPFIVHKNYDGLECDVSEYTMSEIIASVYDMMQNTGIREGILFLDEINCVSETLAPVMLQFLQYKIFGRHKVPDGWIVVTAGNPPEYNNSVREYDIVTWDRLKRIDVEPDFDVWKEYAYKTGVHPAVLTYLEIKKGDFYKIESTSGGKQFVTARGWDDLSTMIKLYEKREIKVTQKLVGQYIQNPKTAKEFAIYYDLFNKYRSDYQVDKILAGKATDEIVGRAISAKFDERLSLLGLILDAVTLELKDTVDSETRLFSLLSILKNIRVALARPNAKAYALLDAEIGKLRKKEASGKAAGNLSQQELKSNGILINVLQDEKASVFSVEDGSEAFKILKDDFDKRTKDLKKQAEEAGKKLSNVFKFCEKAFGDGQEMLILVTELTISWYGAKFISRYGCKEYFEHNKELLFYERQQEIITELEKLELE